VVFASFEKSRISDICYVRFGGGGGGKKGGMFGTHIRMWFLRWMFNIFFFKFF